MTGTVLNFLDTYCERAGDAGMFAEPLNLYTNLFFALAAGISVCNLVRTKSNRSRFDLWMMTLIMWLIGVGSGMWHAIPTGLTVLMDVIPITLFINAYIASALRRLFHQNWWRVLAWWTAYFVASIAAQKLLPPDLLNGTIMYIPTYLALAIMTVCLHRRNANTGSIFGLALGVWTVSLMFRTMDMQLCPNVAVGTHFLWHTLNAWVLWRLLKVLIDDSVAPSRR